MKASELRIGNFVKGKETNVYWTVEAIDSNSIFSHVKWRSLDAFEPIPLTEEWLLKFGFEKVAENDFILGKYSLYYLLYYDGYRVSEITPKYVHQLQNLYFALTGEELIIKNTPND
jgi:hypothetical protein